MQEQQIEQVDKKPSPSFWNTWIGAFLIVPPGFMIAAWAYYEFIGFASRSWAVYQHYSAMTTIQFDVLIVALGILAVYAHKRYVKSAAGQALLSIPLGAIWIAALWAMFDMVLKWDAIAQYRAAVERAIGVANQEPSVLAKFMPFWGLPIEAILVGAIAIGSIVAMCTIAVVTVYIVFFTKKTFSADGAEPIR